MATASLDRVREDASAAAEVRRPAPPCARPSSALTREELTARLAAVGVPERELRMRAAQVWHWHLRPRRHRPSTR